MGRDHDDRQVRVALAQAFEGGDAIDARQAQVQQDDIDIGVLAAEQLQGRLAAVGGTDAHTFGAQGVAQGAHQRFFVVDD